MTRSRSHVPVHTCRPDRRPRRGCRRAAPASPAHPRAAEGAGLRGGGRAVVVPAPSAGDVSRAGAGASGTAGDSGRAEEGQLRREAGSSDGAELRDCAAGAWRRGSGRGSAGPVLEHVSAGRRRADAAGCCEASAGRGPGGPSAADAVAADGGSVRRAGVAARIRGGDGGRSRPGGCEVSRRARGGGPHVPAESGDLSTAVGGGRRRFPEGDDR